MLNGNGDVIILFINAKNAHYRLALILMWNKNTNKLIIYFFVFMSYIATLC